MTLVEFKHELRHCQDIELDIDIEELLIIKTTEDTLRWFNMAFLHENIELKSIIFNEKVSLGSNKFINSFASSRTLRNVNFNGGLIISGVYTQKLSFEECTFKGGVNLEAATFNENIRFHNCKFIKNISCQNTTFKSLVDFWKSAFSEAQQFHLTNFEDRAVFSEVHFFGEVQFIHNNVNPSAYVNFENAIFEKGLDLSRSNFTSLTHFWGVKFDTTSFTNLGKQTLFIDDKVGFANVKTNSRQALKRLRETFRFIKQTFRAQGNNIEALTFHQYEMQIYKDELVVKGKFQEKIILWFNNISNDFGLSWIRGIGFTFMVPAIFFIFMLLTLLNKLEFSCNIDALGLTIKNFFQLLNLTNWNYQPFGFTEINVYTYVILFVAKIFIGYGYYQTIQAFRKFGRN